jgi:hypothetical protein
MVPPSRPKGRGGAVALDRDGFFLHLPPAGFEPATFGSEDRRAIQLRHGGLPASLPARMPPRHRPLAKSCGSGTLVAIICPKATMASAKKASKKPAAKKAPAKKAPAKKPSIKKPSAKKPAPKPKSAPAKKPAKPAAKKPAPAKKAAPQAAKADAGVKKSAPAAVPAGRAPAPGGRPQPFQHGQKSREPSVFRRSSDAPGADGVEEKKGIDRSRLGALQAKIFRPGVLQPEHRQMLAHMVSDISTNANKPRLVRQQVLGDLQKLAKSVKAHVEDAALRQEMLNDIDAFSAIVRPSR